MKKKELDAALNRIFCEESEFTTEVRALLERGVHPDKIVSPTDNVPLLAYMSKLPERACAGHQAEGFIALYQELVARSANVNKTVRNGLTPFSLLEAAASSNEEVAAPLLKCLIAAGGSFNASKDSPICWMIGFGSLKGEIFGWPFEHAPGTEAYEAFWSSVQRLLNAGVDINAFERRGLYNPLMMATIRGAADAVTRLIALGADPNIVNKDGSTALMYAAGDADGLASIVAGICCAWARYGDTLAVTRTLLANGANPMLANTRRRTALGIAQRNECHDVAFELAQALSAQGLLTTQDLTGFKGTPFEGQAYALPAIKPPKKIAALKDTSGAAQLATWDALPGPSSTTEFAAQCALVCALLDAGLRKQLYVDHYEYLGGGLRLSTTKSWLSRKGCIDIRHLYTYERILVNDEPEVCVTTRFVVRHEALNHDSSDTEIRAEREIPMDADGQPDAAMLKEALTALLQTQLNVSISA
jgi:ankyrin repeat protein